METAAVIDEARGRGMEMEVEMETEVEVEMRVDPVRAMVEMAMALKMAMVMVMAVVLALALIRTAGVEGQKSVYSSTGRPQHCRSSVSSWEGARYPPPPCPSTHSSLGELHNPGQVGFSRLHLVFLILHFSHARSFAIGTRFCAPDVFGSCCEPAEAVMGRTWLVGGGAGFPTFPRA